MRKIFVQDEATKLKLLQELDKTHKNFLSTFGINSIYSFQKIGFAVFKGWFFDHIFETRGNFQILFLSRERVGSKKIYEIDSILLQEYYISKKKYAFMLKKSKISQFSRHFLCISLKPLRIFPF